MYFRLEINSNVNSDVMQLSEFSLSIQDVDDMDYAFLPTDGTQRADGQDQYLNLFNNNSQNYWYCPGRLRIHLRRLKKVAPKIIPPSVRNF